MGRSESLEAKSERMEFVVQVLKGVAMEMIARCGIEGYLASGRYVDFQAAAVRDKAMELFEDLWEENDRIGAAFVFVRDGIRHSGDVGSRIVTRTASEVLAAGEGICMAKSHLLAALLRCGGIPAALCYQRLLVDDSPGREFRLHGLNAVYLRSRKCWLRIDARGNKPGVDARFDPDGGERIAYPIRSERGEVDYPALYCEPPALVAEALERYTDRKTQTLGVTAPE